MKRTLILSSLLVLCGCDSDRHGTFMQCVISRPNPVSDNQIKDLKKHSLSGSAQDAFSLAQHYFMLNNGQQEGYWMMIAAENGHAIAQYNYGVELTEDGTEEGKLRGSFWIEASKRCGFKPQPLDGR